MSNTKLIKLCENYNFEQLFKSKNYSFFTNGLYNLNIIGVRNNTRNVITNKFDDCLVLDYNDENGHQRKIYTITTEPGLSSMKSFTNLKGTAILVPGQYKGVYKIDLHNKKYKALCQRNGPVKVYRDGNRNDIYDLVPSTIETGYFGINIHRANECWIRNTVDNYSAGCQVFNDPKEFKEFMNICKKAAEIYGNKFTYTLITEIEML